MAQQPPPPQGYIPPPGGYQPAPYGIPVAGPRFAGFLQRFVAYIIDGFVASLVGWGVAIVLGIVVAAAASSGSDAVTGASITLFVVALMLIGILYYPYFWSHGGQTPGMKLLRVRVVRDADGGPVGWGPAFLRLLGYVISAIPFYLGFIWIAVDARKRGWHDLIAGTCVIEV